MAEKISPETRSKIMSRIKGKNTSPEVKVRSFLHKMGFRYRLHKKNLPGVPDLTLTKYKAVIFIHGCFWHQHYGCKHSGIPLSTQNYWEPKLKKTIKRDQEHQKIYEKMGWRVLIIWECEVSEENLKKLAIKIRGGEANNA